MIENVREQTYRPLEMVIVSDGPDAELREIIAREQGCGDVPILFAELGRNWSTYLTNSHSVAAFGTAQYMARGDLQMWLSDDERCLVPDHIEALVDFLEAGDDQGPFDFVQPLVEVYYE